MCLLHQIPILLCAGRSGGDQAQLKKVQTLSTLSFCVLLSVEFGSNQFAEVVTVQ